MNTDQMYQDFTTKLLPKIQEGLVISKEYFTDLFSRYIKYLIVSDSLLIGFSVTVLFVTPFIFKKVLNIKNEEFDFWPGQKILGVMICLVVIIVSFINLIVNTGYLIKDLYIPEVRIIEQFKDQQ